MPSEISGVIEDYQVKEGSNSKGDWTKHGAKLAGEWYSTFSDSDGQAIAGAFQSGHPIVVEYTQSTRDGKSYRNIKSVRLQGGQPAPAQASGQANSSGSSPSSERAKQEEVVQRPPEQGLEVRSDTTGDELVLLKQYQQAGNVVLFPTSYVRQISPYHVARVELVSIDVERDCYREKNGEYAPKKPALERISDAAGLRWVIEKCAWVKPGPDSYMFTAVGAMQAPDGSWKEFSATKEVILEVEFAEVEERADAKSWESEAKKESYLRAEKLRIRKHAAAMCESKAYNRVIRKALAMNQTYPRAAFAKPLAVPRIDFMPDYSDPAVKQRFLAAGTNAASDLYPQERPGQDVSQPMAPGVDPDTGEILNCEVIVQEEDDDDVPF